ncbi:MAG: efflux RND transporter periplasmic adaptor subunit [Alphaproteobacteria bacterium]|nr:MAG: efflux RND transporter periplasmic adaptor subunit [Alphaproteobacteria bacterium]
MRVSLLCGLLVAGLLAGCRQDAATAPLTRVRVVTAELSDFAPELTLTGVIAARVQSEVSFRVGGKIRERLANVGDHVKADQVLARLDPDEQQAEVQAMQAGVRSAEATLRQATLAFDRQKNLLTTGNTTRREHDQAEASFRSAQAQLEQARAQLAQATDQLAYTELHAGADGIVVAQMAEAGQVVAQAQPVFGLAHDGGRDAVFNVHEWALANTATDAPITVSLLRDPAVRTAATVRLVSPAVDANSMTVQVKLALAETPPAMTLGSLVNGTAPVRPRKAFLLPWSALFEQAGKPAVWLVDRSNTTVSLRPVAIDRFTRDSIAVTGLDSGQTVVTAGSQTLRPGQRVEIATERKP